MIKAVLLVILLAILGTKVYSDQVTSGAFKGINNNESPVIIDPSYAQDLLNVDVTPGGKSVKKRAGYGIYKTLGTGQPLHGGFHAYDSAGNDYQLWGSSTSLYSIPNGGTPIQLISSATLNSTWDCTDTQGNSYCVDSNRDFYIKTDGSTETGYTSPLGTMVESTPDRVVVAGVSGSPNTLFVSQSNTFTNFVTGVNATDAFNEVIAAPGSKITHIRSGCGKLLWWKDQSFGYFDFDDQFVAQIKTVSDAIGTFDNASAVDPGGNVWFRGQDGHTWKYDCSILTKESIEITPNVQVAGKRISNSWTQSTQADFANGSGYATFTDTATQANSVLLQKFSSVSNAGSYVTTACSFANVTGGLSVTSSAGTLADSAATLALPSSLNIGPNWNLAFQFKEAASFSIQFGFAALDSSLNGYGIISSWLAPPPKYNYYLIKYTAGVPSTVGLVKTTNESVDTSVHSLSISMSSAGNYVLRFDTYTASGTDTSFSVNPTNIYFYGNNITNAGSVTVPALSLSASTGTYYSAIENAPNIVNWNGFSASYNIDGGSQTFSIRSGLSPFTVTSTTPAWTSTSPGSVPTISTGTYFQVKDDFSVTSATQNPSLDDFTLSWYEGSAADQAYMLYFDNSIWESVALSSSTNNYIFKFDLINQGWTLYNFGGGGLLSQNNSLYFGDTSSGGNIFNYGTATSDNGNAINAFWKTKDFTGNDPFLQNQLTNIDTFARKNQGSTLSVDYVMDTSTTTSYSMSLSDPIRSIIQSRKLLPSGKLGQVFNVKYSDTSASSAWELLGYRLGFNQLSYRPSN